MDFQESDVWDIMTKTEATPYKGLLSRQLQSRPRLIPKNTNPSPEAKLVNHSAPVNIPDWTPKERCSRNTDQDLYHEGHSTRNRLTSYARNDDECDSQDHDDDDDDHSSCRLPPHEWLARKHTGNRTSSFSVYEGVGRTLKGRDLRRVRDAVLTNTTFI